MKTEACKLMLRLIDSREPLRPELRDLLPWLWHELPQSSKMIKMFQDIPRYFKGGTPGWEVPAKAPCTPHL